ncbi:serine/threonine protein kinase [Lentzea albidocapillata]|uniref:serine/threonine protein kinase n=1 Tax=Lentzea albidocapillata TaxID=40571 RepID=UPI0015A30C67|nr:serine/threonine protein kinase [Lentzea albidocapillata]
MSGEPPINFAAHQVRAGGMQGAREDFENMLSLLVRATRPGARMIAANPGDWGIDVLVGDLGGLVAIWQSKYFFPLVKESHQQEIRDSFKSARTNAEKHGYKLNQWILCVPSSMDPPTASWWDSWKKREQQKYKVQIELWDETELRTQLISPDADHVRRHYYESPRVQPSVRPTPAETAVAQLLPPDEDEKLESALFVRQLREAGHAEVTAAKREFFNAELMAREVVDKGVPWEVAALTTADATVHSVWENRFNDACQAQDDPKLPGLHTTVMTDIRTQHNTFASGLPGGVVHSCGLMHRVVDDRRAGWVKHWRQVADEAVDTKELPDPQTAEVAPIDIARGETDEVPVAQLTAVEADR